MLRDKLNTSMKEALKSGEKDRLSTIRMILANIKQRDIDARPLGQSEGISDIQILQLLQTMVKQRKESIDLFFQGNRADLVEKERKEIDVIESFLPQQMNMDAISQAVQEGVAITQALTVRDMGKVMAYLKERYVGQMDFAKASALIKQHLT